MLNVERSIGSFVNWRSLFYDYRFGGYSIGRLCFLGLIAAYVFYRKIQMQQFASAS